MQKNLINTLNQNIQSNVAKRPLDPHKENFLNSLSSFKFNTLTIGELQLAETYDVKKILGETCRNSIQDILRDEKIDPAGIIQKITAIPIAPGPGTLNVPKHIIHIALGFRKLWPGRKNFQNLKVFFDGLHPIF